MTVVSHQPSLGLLTSLTSSLLTHFRCLCVLSYSSWGFLSLQANLFLTDTAVEAWLLIFALNSFLSRWGLPTLHTWKPLMGAVCLTGSAFLPVCFGSVNTPETGRCLFFSEPAHSGPSVHLRDLTSALPWSESLAVKSLWIRCSLSAASRPQRPPQPLLWEACVPSQQSSCAISPGLFMPPGARLWISCQLSLSSGHCGSHVMEEGVRELSFRGSIEGMRWALCTFCKGLWCARGSRVP